MLKLGKNVLRELELEIGQNYSYREIIEWLFNNYESEMLDRFYDEINDGINAYIDNDLIYDSDMWELLMRNTNPMDLLNGNYTVENLYDDLHEEITSDKDIMADIVYDYVDFNSIQNFINELEEELE